MKINMKMHLELWLLKFHCCQATRLKLLIVALNTYIEDIATSDSQIVLGTHIRDRILKIGKTLISILQFAVLSKSFIARKQLFFTYIIPKEVSCREHDLGVSGKCKVTNTLLSKGLIKEVLLHISCKGLLIVKITQAKLPNCI